MPISFRSSSSCAVSPEDKSSNSHLSLGGETSSELLNCVFTVSASKICLPSHYPSVDRRTCDVVKAPAAEPALEAILVPHLEGRHKSCELRA
jgi:hypothetical protein